MVEASVRASASAARSVGDPRRAPRPRSGARARTARALQEQAFGKLRALHPLIHDLSVTEGVRARPHFAAFELCALGVWLGSPGRLAWVPAAAPGVAVEDVEQVWPVPCVRAAVGHAVLLAVELPVHGVELATGVGGVVESTGFDERAAVGPGRFPEGCEEEGAGTPKEPSRTCATR